MKMRLNFQLRICLLLVLGMLIAGVEWADFAVASGSNGVMTLEEARGNDFVFMLEEFKYMGLDYGVKADEMISFALEMLHPKGSEFEMRSILVEDIVIYQGWIYYTKDSDLSDYHIYRTTVDGKKTEYISQGCSDFKIEQGIWIQGGHVFFRATDRRQESSNSNLYKMPLAGAKPNRVETRISQVCTYKDQLFYTYYDEDKGAYIFSQYNARTSEKTVMHRFEGAGLLNQTKFGAFFNVQAADLTHEVWFFSYATQKMTILEKNIRSADAFHYDSELCVIVTSSGDLYLVNGIDGTRRKLGSNFNDVNSHDQFTTLYYNFDNYMVFYSPTNHVTFTDYRDYHYRFETYDYQHHYNILESKELAGRADGTAILEGETVYFVDPVAENIVKMSLDGNNKTQLQDIAVGTSLLDYSEDWLYYQHQYTGIYRLNHDAQHQTLANAFFPSPLIMDDKIYYHVPTEYRVMNLDGSEDQRFLSKATDNSLMLVGKEDNRHYIYSDSNRTIYKLASENAPLEPLAHNVFSVYGCANDIIIFYDYIDETLKYIDSRKGSKDAITMGDQFGSPLILGTEIYYSNQDDGGFLYRYNLDTRKSYKVADVKVENLIYKPKTDLLISKGVKDLKVINLKTQSLKIVEFDYVYELCDANEEGVAYLNRIGSEEIEYSIDLDGNNMTLKSEPVRDLTAQASLVFKDMPTTNPYYAGADYCYKNGLIRGQFSSDQRALLLNPKSPISRGEFAKLISVGIALDQMNLQSAFKDVSHKWYSHYANLVHNAGIIRGYPDKTFKGDAAISCAEVAAVLSKMIDPNLRQNATVDATVDQDMPWYLPYFDHLKGLNIVTDGEFTDLVNQPDKPISRELVFMLLYRSDITQYR